MTMLWEKLPLRPKTPPFQNKILNGLTAEEVDEFDDQDDDNHEFEHEGAALIEFVHHEAVELFGGLQFLLDEIFVVGHADFRGGEFVEAGGKHIAEELDGVIGALGQFAHVEQNGVEFGGGAGGAPARPKSAASALQEVVDVLELLGKKFVVVAEFQQLRIGILQELDSRFGAGRSVVDKGSIPSDHGEVAGIVGNPRLENFLAFTVGKRLVLTAYHLRNAICLRCQQVRARGGPCNLPQMEDEIVFLQPLGGVRLDQRGGRTLKFLLDDASGEALKVGIPNPATGKLDQLVPVAREWKLEDHADHAVIEVFNLSLEALATF